MQSLNNRFILESYKEDRSIKATINSGFAMIAQKIAVKGLKLLVDTKTSNGDMFFAGSTAYIREAFLQSNPMAKQVFTSEDIDGEFIIIDAQHVEFVKQQESN